MSGWLRIEIVIVELIVFAFDIERPEVDRPVSRVVQCNTKAPIVQSQINPKFLLADDDP